MTATFSAEDVQVATRGRWVSGEPRQILKGVYTDTRKSQQGAVFVALRGPNYDAHEFLSQAFEQGASAIVAEESYLSEHPEAKNLEVPILAVPDTLYALGELARFWKTKLSPRTIAITGSVGKTTVKDMTAEVVRRKYSTHWSRANYNNLIGLPLEILAMHQGTEVLILECGADRPGEIERLTEICRPEIGVITHIVPCHLQRFGSLPHVAKEKGKLLAGLEGPDIHAVINSQAAQQEVLLAGCKAPISFYGKRDKSRLWAETIHFDEKGCATFKINDGKNQFEVALHIPGNHQIENALAAALLGLLLDIPPEEIRIGLEAYSGTWGRMQRTELSDGTLLIEDEYNSNPASMQAALDFLARCSERPRIGIFGEMWDLGPESHHWHVITGKQVSQYHLEIFIAVGPLTEGFLEGIEKSAFPPEQVHYFETTNEALNWLKEHWCPCSLILVKGSRGMKMEIIAEGLKNDKTTKNSCTTC